MSQHHVCGRSGDLSLGVFDAGLQPVLTVMSGDTVAMDCVSAGRYPAGGRQLRYSSRTIWRSTAG